MQVKVIKGNEEQLFECSNIRVTTITEDMAAAKLPIGRQPGLYIELSEVGKVRGAMKTIVLPDDGEIAYVENDNGKTTGTYRWPLRAAGDGR